MVIASRVGNTSLQLKIEVWVKTLMNDMVTEDRQLVTEAVFTYVAIDSQGNPRPISSAKAMQSWHICKFKNSKKRPS